LVIHRTEGACVAPPAGRQLAQKIRGARLVELPGRDHPIWTGDVDRIVDEIEEFVIGERPTVSRERMLATFLVAPERLATRLGDRLWNARGDEGFSAQSPDRAQRQDQGADRLAVTAQIPCRYCIYFHTAAAKANGASDEEIKETVATAAVARHWSTALYPDGAKVFCVAVVELADGRIAQQTVVQAWDE
jgi:AhpD family alkylhydroperoxidase